MKTFWLNFPFNNCNKSGGRWNVPATQGAPVFLPPDWPLQLVVYWFCVLMWCHYSQLTFESHSSDVESSGHHLNVRKRGRRHLAIWPPSLFSYLGTSWTERCRLVRLLYTTDNMTLVWRDVKSSCQFGEFCLCTNPCRQNGGAMLEFIRKTHKAELC